MDLKLKHKEILQDLTDNAKGLHNRIRYYSGKYRGDLNNDINLNIQDHGNHLSIRVYLKNKVDYINHTLSILRGTLREKELIHRKASEQDLKEINNIIYG